MSIDAGKEFIIKQCIYSGYIQVTISKGLVINNWDGGYKTEGAANEVLQKVGETKVGA